MSRAVATTTLKRWIAAVCAILAVAVALTVLGLTSAAVQRAGLGADPSEAFVPTDVLAADVTWQDDADGLVRPVSGEVRTALADAWVRSQEALARAAAGDIGGLDAWFSDAALEQATARFADDAWQTEAPPLTARHELRVDFVSLDGQIVLLTIETSATDGAPTTATAVVAQVEGSWRIRTLRTDAVGI